jgi:hypothetical protein
MVTWAPAVRLLLQDAVSLCDASGNEFARGLSNFDSKVGGAAAAAEAAWCLQNACRVPAAKTACADCHRHRKAAVNGPQLLLLLL